MSPLFWKIQKEVGRILESGRGVEVVWREKQETPSVTVSVLGENLPRFIGAEKTGAEKMEEKILQILKPYIGKQQIMILPGKQEGEEFKVTLHIQP